MPSNVATSAHGLTFSFDSTALTVTNVQVQDNSDVIDASHLGLAQSARREYIVGLKDSEVTIDYLSATILNAGDEGALAISGPFTYSGNATITAASIGGTVGDLVKGSATFKVSS